MNLLFFFLALSACILAACAAKPRDQLVEEVNILMSQMFVDSPFTPFFKNGKLSSSIANVKRFMEKCEDQRDSLMEAEQILLDYRVLCDVIDHLDNFIRASTKWITKRDGTKFDVYLLKAHRLWRPIRKIASSLKNPGISPSSTSNGASSEDSMAQRFPSEILDEKKFQNMKITKIQAIGGIKLLQRTRRSISTGDLELGRFDFEARTRIEDQTNEYRKLAEYFGPVVVKIKSMEASKVLVKHEELIDDLSTMLAVIGGIIYANDLIIKLPMITTENCDDPRDSEDCEMAATNLAKFLEKSSILESISSSLYWNV